MIDLSIYCKCVDIVAFNQDEVNVKVLGISSGDAKNLIMQFVSKVSTCEILDNISKEDIDTYIKETYGVTLMKK